MNDRELVKEYLRNYLKSSALFGFSNHLDMKQTAQVMRRLYKTPLDCDSNQILDFLILLASSGQYYGDFDTKSVAWIEKALDFVESKFTGTSFVEVDKLVDIKDSTAIQNNDLIEGSNT